MLSTDVEAVAIVLLCLTRPQNNTAGQMNIIHHHDMNAWSTLYKLDHAEHPTFPSSKGAA